MNSIAARRAVSALALGWAVVWVLVAGGAAWAQDLPHLSVVQPGGMPGMPVITGIQRVTNGVNLTWDGPSGYYKVFQRLGLTSPWQQVGALNTSRQATLPANSGNAFFRVSGPAGVYEGIQACSVCHKDPHDTVVLTPHLSAFTNALFVSLGGQTNQSCLPCHTVGGGLSGGFKSAAATPQLEGAQCENCHGPAANHMANPDDPTVRPRIELAGTMCGGCHNTTFVPAQAAVYHLPFYEEWSKSPHQAVVKDVATEFNSPLGPSVFIPTCGQCHSGTVRESLLEGEPLPDGHEAGAVGIACATCHEPHQLNVFANVLNGVFTNRLNGVVVTNHLLGPTYTNQLRNPLASLQDYHITGSFATNYNPNINACAQCHNDRGAVWTSTDREPHHSLQYNLLLGTVGGLGTNNAPGFPGTHVYVEKQCAGCHVQMTNSVSPGQPSLAGHKFEVNTYGTCGQCHNPATASGLVDFLQMQVRSNPDGWGIYQVKALLDQWATNVAPAQLRTNYGVLSWEYSNPGSLSTGVSGPKSNEQSLIPTAIKQARFDLYLAYNDGSFGVHNPLYVINLLLTAQSLVEGELNPGVAQYRAIVRELPYPPTDSK